MMDCGIAFDLPLLCVEVEDTLRNTLVHSLDTNNDTHRV